MLKGEWDKWWSTLPALEAREALQLYRVLLVTDAGWQIDDRGEYLREWQQQAEGAQALRVPTGVARGPITDISHEVRNLFGWLQQQWGQSSSANDVDGRVGFGGEVVSLR